VNDGDEWAFHQTSWEAAGKGPRRAFFCFDDCGNPQYYRAIKSIVMNIWQDISPILSFPKGIRLEMVSMARRVFCNESKIPD
jgi:hypothetical protein